MERWIFRKSPDKFEICERHAFILWSNTLTAGYYKADFSRVAVGKTREQLGYYYAAVLPTVRRWMIDAGWDSTACIVVSGTRVPMSLSDDHVDDFLKALYALDRGLELPPRKSSMDKDQMTDYLNFVLAWAHENGIGIPAPHGED